MSALLAMLVLLGPALAEDSGEESEEDEAPPSRDDEIFGSPAETAPVEVEPPPDSSPLGSPTLSDADIFDRLDEADSRLTVGGQLYLRLDAGVPDPGWLEGKGSGEDKGFGAEDVSLDSPNLLDLYADARPTDRLRAYSRARLRHDLSVLPGDTDPFTGEERSASQVSLDQLWLNFDIGHRVFVTAGRQRIKWGAGRFWNPTDFLAPGRLDALAFFDERTGVGLVKVHLPVGTTNLYAIADIEGADALDQVGGAGRAEVVVGLTEVALSAAGGKDRPTQLGGQLSTGIWLFDLKGEAAVTHGLTSPFWEGTLDLETLTLPTEVSREEDWIVQAVGGAEIGIRLNDEDTLYLGGEYFYNDAGYDDAELYTWLLLQGQAEFFYLGRQYFGAYAWLPGPGPSGIWDDMNWSAAVLGNLSDQSTVARLDWSALLLTRLSVNAYVAGHFGEAGGEFRYALELPAIPGMLDDPLEVPPPLVDVGLGASLSF